MGTSFIVLLIYGIRLNLIVSDKLKSASGSLKYTALGAVVTLVVASAIYYLNRDTENSASMFVRSFLGFPSALLSGIGMIGYSKAVKHMSAEGAKSFAASGAAMIAYALLTGFFPSDTIVPGLNIKIVAFRGICAVVILHFMMKALTVFDVEHMKMIEARLQGLAQSEKLSSIGKLAAGIAHEINNQLTNASLGIEIVKDRIGDNPAVIQKQKAATIVSPGKLSAERQTVICGQCHSRPQGNLNNDQPVDKNNRMMLPCTSRNNYLLNNTTREDAAR